VGNKLRRFSRLWRSNSFAPDFCAHIIHDLRVHWKRRSRIMVGFARDEIEERSIFRPHFLGSSSAFSGFPAGHDYTGVNVSRVYRIYTEELNRDEIIRLTAKQFE
jgi:hypothetical protein